MKLRRKKGRLRLYLALIAASLPAGWLLAFSVHSLRVFPVRLTGNEMAPEFPAGTKIFITRSFSKENLKTGDIVLSRHPFSPEIRLLRRIAAVPGDSVAVTEGILYVNGTAVKKIAGAVIYPDGTVFDHNMKSVLLGKDEYFLLSDNEAEGIDSRHFGPVNLIHIEGIKD